jgi:AraC-like DNA-binding protein
MDGNWVSPSFPRLSYAHAAWSLLQFGVLLVYGLLALQRIKGHARRFQQTFSTVDEVDLRWLQWLILAIIVVHALHVFEDLLPLFTHTDAWVAQKIINQALSVIAAIYLITIGGLRQAIIFTRPVKEALTAVDRDTAEPGAEKGAAAADKSPRYTKSGLDEAAIDGIWARLQTCLDEKKPYLDPLLDLPKLARQLGVRPQELSLVINARSGGAFYELINRCRVETAKTLLAGAAGQRSKMVDIALAAGFSSHSTFSSQFRKFTGSTPTAYRDSAGRARSVPSP